MIPKTITQWKTREADHRWYLTVESYTLWHSSDTARELSCYGSTSHCNDSSSSAQGCAALWLMYSMNGMSTFFRIYKRQTVKDRWFSILFIAATEDAVVIINILLAVGLHWYATYTHYISWVMWNNNKLGRDSEQKQRKGHPGQCEIMARNIVRYICMTDQNRVKDRQ